MVESFRAHDCGIGLVQRKFELGPSVIAVVHEHRSTSRGHEGQRFRLERSATREFVLNTPRVVLLLFAS